MSSCVFQAVSPNSSQRQLAEPCVPNTNTASYSPASSVSASGVAAPTRGEPVLICLLSEIQLQALNLPNCYCLMMHFSFIICLSKGRWINSFLSTYRCEFTIKFQSKKTEKRATVLNKRSEKRLLKGRGAGTLSTLLNGWLVWSASF